MRYITGKEKYEFIYFKNVFKCFTKGKKHQLPMWVEGIPLSYRFLDLEKLNVKFSNNIPTTVANCCANENDVALFPIACFVLKKWRRWHEKDNGTSLRSGL